MCGSECMKNAHKAPIHTEETVQLLLHFVLFQLKPGYMQKGWP